MPILSRRRFLHASAVLAASTAAACTGGQAPSTGNPSPSTPPARPGGYSEAPMLAALVKEGKLPPVGQRLPLQPVVVKPAGAIGRYGGTLRGAALAPDTTNDLQVGMVTGLFSFSHDLKERFNELAESAELSKDFKTCTIKVREGLKWSDGQPFLVDDVLFYFQDWQFDKDLMPTTDPQWSAGGQRMTVTRIDDRTVQFTFAVPHPSFSLLHYAGGPATPFAPRHYLQRFHLKYNPNADAEAKQEGFATWQARFLKLATWHYGTQDPGVPVLDPWRPMRNDSSGQYYERNPYYFKVDSAGNQLPYVDRLEVRYSTGIDAENVQVVSGQVDVAGLDLALANFPVIKDGESKGGYRALLAYSERGADVALAFNQLHPDPVLRGIFADVRFRQACSSAIDRNEINKLVFLGQGKPRQATINDSASFYKKAWGDAYARHDTALAGRLLDEVGVRKGPNGVRLRPDGKELSFLLEFLPQEGPKQQVCELVVRHWAQVGLKAQAAPRERGYLLTRLQAGQQDVTAWHVDRQLERAAYAYGAGGSKFGPGGNSAIEYAHAWVLWLNSGGARGTEPPDEAKQLRKAFEDWQLTDYGTPEYVRAGQNVYDQVARTLWVIGTVGEAPDPVVISNRLGNAVSNDIMAGKQRMWWGAANWFWHPHRAEQWFIKG